VLPIRTRHGVVAVVLKVDQHNFVACHQLDFSKPELHAYRPAIIELSITDGSRVSLGPGVKAAPLFEGP
jgi:hypothetical protein